MRSGLRDSAHRLGLASFWRWWIGQLAPLVPLPARAALQRRRLRPVLQFEATYATLWEPRVVDAALRYVEAARFDVVGDATAVAQAGRAAIDGLPLSAYGVGGGAPAVFVALAPSKVLRKRLVLPAAVEQNLKQALAYDLDRHTPFRADELYFDAAIAERNVAKREIVVDWAAARRADVDAARRTAESFGARVASVVADAPARADPMRIGRLDLLPDGGANADVWWRQWHVWVPAAVLVVAAAIALLLPIWQKRDYAIALNRQVDDAHQQAIVADRLREQLEQQMGDYNFVLAKKYAFASATQTLDDVTKLLPDDTWLTQLELKTTAKAKDTQRELLLRGESGNAGRLVSLLEDSKLFDQAAPRSPTTKIQPGPGEIFDLGAIVKPLPPPGAIVNGPAAASNAPPAADKAPTPVATAAPIPAAQPAAASAPAAAPMPAASQPPAARAAPPAAPPAPAPLPMPVQTNTGPPIPSALPPGTPTPAAGSLPSAPPAAAASAPSVPASMPVVTPTPDAGDVAGMPASARKKPQR